MQILKKIKDGIISLFKGILFLFKFLILLLFVFIRFLLDGNGNKGEEKKPRFSINLKPIADLYEKLYNKILLTFDRIRPGEIRSSELIFLSLRNLRAKKTRTYLTVGGMAIGFGAIIFLLSLGYGFERLVISEVASLNELKQIDVYASATRPIKFNQETIAEMEAIENVKDVIPIISSVSKVKFNDSVSDVIVYGVNSRYMEEVGFHPLRGGLFEEGSINFSQITSNTAKVAGATLSLISNDALGQSISDVEYSIYPETFKPVYGDPQTSSSILGYAKREPGEQEGVEVWGEEYAAEGSILNAKDISGDRYSSWIKGSFALWELQTCSTQNVDCLNGSYLMLRENDAQKIVEGFITEDNVSFNRFNYSKGGAMEVFEGKVIDEVEFKLKADTLDAYISMNKEGEKVTLLNEDKEATFEGELVLGGEYGSTTFLVDDEGVKYGYWIKAKMTLYSKDCTSCFTYSNLASEGSQSEMLEVFFKSSDAQISSQGKVLGTETTSGNFVDINTLSEEDDGIDWVNLAEELGTTEVSDADILPLPAEAQKVAVVNTAMLNILGLTSDEAIDKEFEATLVFDSILFDKTNYTAESEPVDIKIVGVISDSKSPTFYAPINDLKVEGLLNVSYLKVVASDSASVADIRGVIESIGLQTKSVMDTVKNINSLFDSLRIVLLVLGLIALGVAALGMFNTLTVSLLEKTREVGLLKTMGLKSYEVRIVFLSESVIMSILGGLIGLFIAFAGGQLVSILLSILSATQGMGTLDVAFIPASLSITILIISAVVGFVTGWYPAKRAKRISALHALRYE